MDSRSARPARAAVVLIVAALAALPFVGTATAANGLELTTPYPAVAVAPNSKVSFDLTITSTRQANVALRLTGVPSGWTASVLGGGFIVDSVAVTPGKAGTARLDVSVPADATPSTQTIRLTATGGGATAVLPVTIRVNTSAAGDVSLTTATPTLTGASDANFSFDLQFKNDTAQDLTLSVSATGEPSWDIKASLAGQTQAASTIVKAGSSQSVTVTAKAAADTPAGSYPIKVTAQAGDRTATADLGIEVTGSYSMTLSTPNNLLSAHGSAGGPTTQTFTVSNDGTAPITAVSLTGTPPTGWDVKVTPETLPAIPPSQTGTFTATITPSRDAVAGDYVVSFSAKAAEPGATGTSDIRFTVETSPLWAIVGLGIIVLILAGLFYVFRTYGRR